MINEGSIENPPTVEIKNAISSLLNTLYPIGSLYIGTQTTCPLSDIMPETTWTLLGADKALWTANGTNANTTIPAGLPDVVGTIQTLENTATGAFTITGNVVKDIDNGSTLRRNNVTFKSSNSNSIYGNSTTVQPPAYRVNVWRRTA